MTSTFGIAASFLAAPSRRTASLPQLLHRSTVGSEKPRLTWYFADELGLMLQLNALHMPEV
jgi:hypothetical protein